jgi:hypothetical protein
MTYMFCENYLTYNAPQKKAANSLIWGHKHNQGQRLNHKGFLHRISICVILYILSKGRWLLQ